MIVKDSMVVIHLAKITLLKKSCEYFKNVIIPEGVYNEILIGKEKGYPDVAIIAEFIKTRKIIVKQVKDKAAVRNMGTFNLQGGEAEALALYWQEKADYLATDDDNVRKKNVLLEVKLIGTPAIILKLYKENLIGRDKFKEALIGLRKIGWFSTAIIDKVFMEGEKWDGQ